MPANRLVCRLCLHTGMRIGDALALKTEQLRQRFTITEQKTGKRKRITLPDGLLRDLRRQAGSVYVFPGRDSTRKHRTRQAVYLDIKRAAKAFRVKMNVAPHSIRKVYAVELMRKYGDIARVRRALNHDNEFVTLIYALADKVQGNMKL